MVAIVPGATYRQLPCNYTAEHWDYSNGLVLHVQAGNGELSGWFSQPAASASSHWWVAKDGRIFQYLDPIEHQSWAQAAGNSEWHSVETEGQPDEPLTAAQIAGVATIYRWGHDQFGWPYQLAETPGQKGLGWHGMGGSSWGGHTGCPGDLRKPQRSQILAAASGGTTTTPTGGTMTRDQLVALLQSITYGAQGTMLSRIEKLFLAAEDWLAGVSRGNDPRADKNGRVSLKQEIADSKTMLLALTKDIAAIKTKVGA